MIDKEITLHHTAGKYIPNYSDMTHYHLLILPTGEIKKCQNFTVKLEFSCYNHNTGNIGLSCCGMEGAWFKNFGKFPITAKQIDSMITTCCILSLLKNIPMGNIKTHAERSIEDGYPLAKWDFAILKAQNIPYTEAQAKQTGDLLRRQIAARLNGKKNLADYPADMVAEIRKNI